MTPVTSPRSPRLLAAGFALLLAGCASAPVPPGISDSPWAIQSGTAASDAGPWTHKPLPGKAATRFQYERHLGRDAVAVQADASASLLRQSLRIEPQQLGQVRFSWKVSALIAGADLASRDKADAPVRIVLAFEGDRSRFSPRDAALSELVRALTGEEMPYATLMYVWCNQRAPGTVIRNTRTDRIRKLVVESGPGSLNRWLDYERDIRADYERAFGEPPGALVGVALMTDTDNTQSLAEAWYGPVRFLPASR
ncbi:DUF3047 domain-containing protein [Ramlibacter pallidus]|uniref:DUF3047 domain-containing protein n=1 Tax=Ramlibacter pallidus TaxID=2780087 RepID=A0ABR9RZR9_9BURK|nr:DUF3047 domain-containing protein [Ramlibacter pallidus]MBE7366758.1 DUF3047 domain-containing protein [Ramlibacter pallidus]